MSTMDDIGGDFEGRNALVAEYVLGLLSSSEHARIGNLIDNAIKYGHKAHLRVEDNATAFVLHVDDEGPGVPEQRLEQVFEPHFRLAGSQQQGYGLGLGIARNIAHSHGGEVSLQNLRGGGLRVTLYLPRTAD